MNYKSIFKLKKTYSDIILGFAIISILNLLFIVIYSFGKSIIYEDSYVLLNPGYSNLIEWLFKPHNEHIIATSKFITYFFSILSLNPTGYNILISILILLTGTFFINRIVYTLIENKSIRKYSFYFCTFIWISPFQWENLIWEFQFPWFLISLMVLILTLINVEELKGIESKIFIKKIFIFISPIIAVITSAQGICYVGCLSFYLVIKNKKDLISTFGTIIAIMIFIYFKKSSEITLESNFFDNLKYFFIILSSTFKPSISSFNKNELSNWYVPFLSNVAFNLASFFYIFRALILIKMRDILKEISFIITPILFGVQFSILTSLSRSKFGFHQGLVSRYSTVINLVTIGIFITCAFLYSKLEKEKNSKIYSKNIKLINQKRFSLYISLITFIVIINSFSILKTIYETYIVYSYRQNNFYEFIEICKINEKFGTLADDKLLEKYSNLKIYTGVNKPPLPKANNLKNFKEYLNQDYCKLTLRYFN